MPGGVGGQRCEPLPTRLERDKEDKNRPQDEAEQCCDLFPDEIVSA